MSSDERGVAIALFSLFVTLSTLTYVFGYWRGQVDSAIKGLKEDVKGIKDYLWQRAEVTALQKGYAIRMSPLTVTEEAKALLKDKKDDLRAFYKKLGRKMTDSELAFEINKHFGEWLQLNVCEKVEPPMNNGECLVIACAVAKEDETMPPGTK